MENQYILIEWSSLLEIDEGCVLVLADSSETGGAHSSRETRDLVYTVD